MLTATEFYKITPLLCVVFWVETIVYLLIGVIEIFDDFFAKPKSWTKINGKPNGYLILSDKIGHKMHGSLCFLLGFIALNGLIIASVSRFEIELCFLSLALLMMVVWMTVMPGRFGFLVVTATKPEFWLQIIMFVFYSALIQPAVLYICIALNLWGIIVNIFQTRKKVFIPYTYEAVRIDMLEAGVDKKEVKTYDKIAGRIAS